MPFYTEYVTHNCPVLRDQLDSYITTHMCVQCTQIVLSYYDRETRYIANPIDESKVNITMFNFEQLVIEILWKCK